MKYFKSIIAIILAAIMIFSLTACHKKNEVVMTIGDTEIQSGLYLSMQYTAYSEFMDDVNKSLGDNPDIGSYADYKNYIHPDDGKSMTDWVNERTKQLCMQYAALQKLSADNGIALTVDDESYVDNYAKYYWENNLQMLYESNGVSYDSYKKSIAFNYKLSKLFNFYYDTADESLPGSGSKAVSEDEIKGQINKNYILADSLSTTVSATYDENGNATEITEDQKNEAKSKLDAYAQRINSGKATFETIKTEYEAENPSSQTSQENNTVPSSEKYTSIYPGTAKIFSAEDTNPSNYELYRKQADSEGFEYSKAYVISNDAGTTYQLIVLYDLSKDDYYLEYYHNAVIHAMKYEEFENFLNEQANTYNLKENSKLIAYYSPEKIDFDKAAEQASKQK